MSSDTQTQTQTQNQSNNATTSTSTTTPKDKDLETVTSVNTCPTTLDEDERIDVQFGTHESDDETNEGSDSASKKEDLSKYTVVDADHLDEDQPIKGQEFCLFSFMSPEGIMNCNVRAVKFRGAFPTLAKAEEKARELEKTDKYFKIFIGESGKWLDFDPPVSRVDREMSSNKEHQKILDVQRKQRMDKINSLAGKTKELMDKKEKGKIERITESKKAGAANDAVEKQRAKKAEKAEKVEQKVPAPANQRAAALENAKARMRKRLEESQNKKALANLGKEEMVGQIQTQVQETVKGSKDKDKIAVPENIENKIKVVGKASENLEDQKAKLAEADKNIENIKQLMAKRRAQKNTASLAQN